MQLIKVQKEAITFILINLYVSSALDSRDVNTVSVSFVSKKFEIRC